MKPVRFLPLVALSASFLLVLKVAGLVLGGPGTLSGTKQSLAQSAPAETKAPAKPGPADQLDAPSKEEQAQMAAEKKKTAADRKNAPPVDIAALEGDNNSADAEAKLLISLGKRRKELDKRERDFSLRLTLMEAAQKRIDERIAALKKLEGKIQQFSKAQKKEKKQQFQRLVKMYSSMKPKGAARIFNALDQKVLLGIIKQMKPAIMSAILAAMDPVKAREMTISLAGATKQDVTMDSLDQLPKISGN